MGKSIDLVTVVLACFPAFQTSKLLEEKEDHIETLRDRVATLEQRLRDHDLSGDEQLTALQNEVRQDRETGLEGGSITRISHPSVVSSILTVFSGLLLWETSKHKTIWTYKNVMLFNLMMLYTFVSDTINISSSNDVDFNGAFSLYEGGLKALYKNNSHT